MNSKAEYEKIGAQIVDAAFQVHRELGPGLLESVYEICMIEELGRRNIIVENQVRFPVFYKEEELGKEFIIDLLIEGKIIIELKAVEDLKPIHEVQLVTYLKLTNLHLGYLINFNDPLIKNGIKRKINGYII